jgi:hypothetical protein
LFTDCLNEEDDEEILRELEALGMDLGEEEVCLKCFIIIVLQRLFIIRKGKSYKISLSFSLSVFL